MSNEWLNNLRSRMNDHEEDVPDGLWDEISDELFSGKEEKDEIAGFAPEANAVEPKGDVRTNGAGRSLFYRIGGVAAAIALLFLMLKIGGSDHETKEKFSQKKSDLKKQSGQDLTSGKIENNTISEGYTQQETGISLAQNVLNAIVPEKMIKSRNFVNSGAEKADLIPHLPEMAKTANTQETEQKEGQIAVNVPKLNENIVEPTREQKTDEVAFKEDRPIEKYADLSKNKTVKSHKDKSWMLSMLTGNASTGAAEQQFPGYASISGKPMNIEQVWSASVYDDNPLTAILLANQSQPVEARIRHKVPVTFGLSLYYNLGKKWGIGTGLNYTKLSSELHSGTDNNYIKGDQSVHYLGIPVQVNYNVIRKGRFTGYVTGGALVEKPIAGNITTTYVVDDEVKETSKENLSHKPFQFSVNTAVGLQLKIIDKLGVYAEPGIGYHFKDETAPNTIYKEKPLQFNMKFGLRLLLD
ncbi:PorT family protein [Chryseobacterium indologenes]|uniref:porin family protein n=1 Tax=Chryseobacterium TaxID=59732 RepID=UPI000489FD15|nr:MULTISPECIES: porin family protein [Chryseobacterium]ATN07344.1 PorT family protein [Chryseobacterium indologenes]AYY83908.1 PorT family protein [Chryseobacterium indologenes]QIX80837.1 PorT family protein [Chryseobacterium indologenes]HAO27166.1 PorT family protein [Chryseobacterium indologenes]